MKILQFNINSNIMKKINKTKHKFLNKIMIKYRFLYKIKKII